MAKKSGLKILRLPAHPKKAGTCNSKIVVGKERLHIMDVCKLPFAAGVSKAVKVVKRMEAEPSKGLYLGVHIAKADLPTAKSKCDKKFGPLSERKICVEDISRKGKEQRRVKKVSKMEFLGDVPYETEAMKRNVPWYETLM